ncbi:hypothetical protein AB6A40_007036 [Gnathostoma spinigerum]|uniref:Uncharacterized protein n=1 Tax=Gnathostoma spinigerum TaxID=75299 RepID=A0ABD6EUG6_9BILA
MSRHGSRFFTNPFFNSVEEGAREVNLAWLKREARAYISSITSRTPDEENYYGGAYTGIAGEGYGVLRASILFPENSENYLKFCEELVRTQIRHNKGISSRKDSQFILGMLGVYVMKSFCDKKRGTFDSKTLQHIIETTHKSLVSGYQREGDDEMLTGRAGILAAALNLKFISSDESIPEDLLKQVIDKILESGREYSLRNGSPCPLMYQWHGKEYLGAAHGLMGILQMLLRFIALFSEFSSLLKILTICFYYVVDPYST